MEMIKEMAAGRRDLLVVPSIFAKSGALHTSTPLRHRAAVTRGAATTYVSNRTNIYHQQ
jgi:hypothetical protein